ncbi:MAG TPA: DUF6064 family protein [Balneolales bacterium]|nr:DUF6064 family protein [Balneolales bacterium]
MDIPFSPEQFLNLFETYNHFIQPLQIIAYILGLLSILFLFRKNKITPKIITGILATFWIWIGFFYHILFFSSINKAAYLFGSLFIIQGFFFMYTGIIRRKLDFHIEWNITTISGFIIILYAMIIYPILNILLGHSYPRMPVFGVTPCPTTIFTFGFILFIKNKISLTLIIIPLLWALIGTSAALYLHIYEDLGLMLSGILTLSLLIYKRKIRLTFV